MATKKKKIKNLVYSIEMAFNGITRTLTTEYVEEAIASMQPDLLHTESYVTVRSGDFMAERRLSRVQTQRVFLDDVTRQVFVQNLLLN